MEGIHCCSFQPSPVYRAAAFLQYQPEMEIVILWVTGYNSFSQLLQREEQAPVCIHALSLLPYFMSESTLKVQTLCVFPTLALRGHQSEEIGLHETISFLNTVGCGMSCQKGISTVPCRLNKP